MMMMLKSILLVAATLVSSEKTTYEPIANFHPMTLVTDENALAYDQQKIEELIDRGTREDMISARRIYEEGSYSNSVARLWIPEGLPVPVDRLESFKGVSVDGKQVELYSMGTYEDGVQEIDLHYASKSSSQKDYSRCHVGGNPEPFTKGCLKAEGKIKYDISEFDYVYDVATDNRNYRHLQSQSIHADYRMRPNGNKLIPFFSEFQHFVDYYGSFDAANSFIEAAFEGVAANLGHSYYDFSRYGLEARGEVVKIATVQMIVHYMVIRSLETAIVECDNNCRGGECSDSHLHMLDEAAAFYTGATEGTDGSGAGHLAYALADKMCVPFRTCGKEGNVNHGTSYVNHKILEHFEEMQDSLVHRKCADVRKMKTKISALMHVPIIQAILLHAHENQERVGEEKEAQGVAYSAALAPMLHFCKADDSNIVANNMKVGGAGLIDFEVVKSTLERNYDCMAVTCSEVGGLWNPNKWKFIQGAEPCGDYEILPSPFQQIEHGIAELTKILLIVGSLVSCCLMFLFYQGRKAMRRRKFEIEHGIDYDSDSDSDDSDNGVYA